MKITDHVHEIRMPFQSIIGGGCTVERVVNLWIVCNEQICLIDSGVLSSDRILFEYLGSTGRRPQDVQLLVLTHSHPDHIGSAPTIVRRTGCKTAAHVQAVPWIEDVGRQFKEHPLDNFYDLVEGSFKIDKILRDGDMIELDDGLSLDVIHTPGHSKDSISFFLKADGALFTGDAIPVAGDLPIYEDVVRLIASIQKLKALKGVKVLFSSWSALRHAGQIDGYIDESLNYIQRIHETVCQSMDAYPDISSKDLCAKVLKKLELPDASNKLNVVRSIEAHRACSHRKDLLTSYHCRTFS
ncbi:MAG: MBL fold metallo-hydrolase [Thermodesulfobacteriota bacterium]